MAVKAGVACLVKILLIPQVRVAVISHAFPPSPHANGKRPYYIAQGFLEAGWEVDVFTSNIACDLDYEETLNHSQCRVIRVSDPVVRWLDRLKPCRFLYRVALSVANACMWPDFYAVWARNVFKRLRKEGDYDRVLAFVFPSSVYLAAKKDMVDRSWMFDLQEAVTPQYKILPRRSPLQKWRLPQLARLEKKALHAAGQVVYTAATNREAYISAGLVPKKTSAHIPYFFDANVFGSEKNEIVRGFEIRYFGAFDWRGSRSPQVFLKALSGFLDKHPKAREQTKFVFYGMWNAKHDILLKELNLEDVTDIRGSVPYGKYLQEVKRAPVLLLVISSEHNLFMPSKIVDYFGSGRPILAYVPEGSEMRHVLEEANMEEQTVSETDIKGGTRTIETLWTRYSSGTLGEIDANTNFWSSDVQIPRYLNLAAMLNTKK